VWRWPSWVASTILPIALQTDLLQMERVELCSGTHMTFRIELERSESTQKNGKSLNARLEAVCRILRLFMIQLGSGLKLDNWDAVRKHLTPDWWKNTTKVQRTHPVL
jgi:hypothetical protein